MMTYSPFGRNHGYFEETKTICHNLRHLKDLSGLSYRKLSVELGFGPKSLLNYITGYVRPNRERLAAIVSFFNVEDIEDLCMDEWEFKQKYPEMRKEA